MPSSLTAVVLAAGKGTRMGTALPKTAHPVAGRPMLARILQSLKEAGIDQIRVVTGGPGDGGSVGGSVAARLVSSIAEKFGAAVFPQSDAHWGTAKAVAAARPQELSGEILIVSGDHPLVSAKDFRDFTERARLAGAGKPSGGNRPAAAPSETASDLAGSRDASAKQALASAGAAFAVGVFERRDAGDYGRIVLDDTGCIQEIQERCEQEKEPAKKSQDEKSAQGAGGASGAPRYGPGVIYRFDLKNQETRRRENPPGPPYQGGRRLSEKPDLQNRSNQISITGGGGPDATASGGAKQAENSAALKPAVLVNAGLYWIKAEILNRFLNKISKNHKGEYNLTDMASLVYKSGGRSFPVTVSRRAAFGVNSQRELAAASQYLFRLKREALMREGVIFIDPLQTYAEPEASVGAGTILYPGVYIKGRTKIGSFCALESHVFIADSVTGSFVNVRAGSYIEEAVLGEKSVVGPYAHLRKGTVIGKECRVGNFVETKNIKIGDKSKAAHLSYLGDGEIGEETNIGCGTVTCNYGTDGKKRKTFIKDKVFIGSGSQLIAPLTVESGAVVGAGSVITKDVPADSLSLERGEQVFVKNYRKRKKDS